MARMLGPSSHVGPGGRDCVCCNEPPGKKRKARFRVMKRSERNAWKREIRVLED
jgi:hypothetical protein